MFVECTQFNHEFILHFLEQLLVNLSFKNENSPFVIKNREVLLSQKQTPDLDINTFTLFVIPCLVSFVLYKRRIDFLTMGKHTVAF